MIIDSFSENLAGWVEAAGKNILTLISLIVILFSAVAYVFFRNEGVKFKFAVILILFFGSSGVVYSILQNDGTMPSNENGDNTVVPILEPSPSDWSRMWMVNFEPNSAELTNVSTRVLEAVLNTCEDGILDVVGHTDSVGSQLENQILAEKMASSVADYLRSRDADARSISAYGIGESSPIATNTTTEGRRMNRRVEIICNRAIKG